MKKVNFIGFVILVSFYVFLRYWEPGKNEHPIEEYQYKLSFKGIINNKQQLIDEHNIPRFDVKGLDKEITITLQNNPNSFFEYIQNGDSICKESNSIFCYIIRNGDSTKIQFSYMPPSGSAPY